MSLAERVSRKRQGLDDNGIPLVEMHSPSNMGTHLVSSKDRKKVKANLFDTPPPMKMSSQHVQQVANAMMVLIEYMKFELIGVLPELSDAA